MADKKNRFIKNEQWCQQRFGETDLAGIFLITTVYTTTVGIIWM